MQTTAQLQLKAPVVEPLPRMALGSSDSDRNGRVWLISPWFDALFVAGLAPWFVGIATFVLVSQRVVANSPSKGPQEHALTILFVLASLLIGEAHQFTSIVRYFGSVKGRRKKYWLHRVPFWFFYSVFTLAAALIIGREMFPKAIDKITEISTAFDFLNQIFGLGQQFFPTVLMHHVCAQALAIGLIYCGAQGYKLSRFEKIWFTTTMWSLVVAGATTLAAPFDIDVNLLLVPRALAVPIATAFVLLSALLVIRRGLRSREWLPLGSGMLWINLSALILLPLPMMSYVWVFVPLLLHASQHWVVAWVTQQRDSEKNGTAPRNAKEALSDMVRLVLPVQALTIAVLFAPIWLAKLMIEPVPMDQFSTLSVGSSIFVFYVHYFADRIVWRPQS